MSSGSEVESQVTAVFDLDGTLLSGDSMRVWLREQVHGSPARMGIALILAPVWWPLLLWARTRRYGASLFLWIATVGCNSRSLTQRFGEFAQRVHAGTAQVQWYPDALKALEGHLQAGHRVAVVTAVPIPLLEQLLQQRYPHVTLIGSSIRRFALGWVGQRYCRGIEKCRLLEENDFGSTWDFAYSDNADDVSLLRAARSGHVINATAAVRRCFEEAGLSNVQYRVWM